MASAQASADDHQRAVLERQLHGLPNDAAQPNSKRNITIYATKLDKVILSLSSICAIIAGALNPLVPVIYGLLVNVFNGFSNGSVEASKLRSEISTFSLYYVYLSIALFVFTYLGTLGFYFSGDRIARALRIAYLEAVIRQNMAFFDVLRPGEISNRIMSDMGILQEAITSKTSIMLSAVATFCAAFIISFIMYWKTALILSPFFVTMLLMFSVGGSYSVKHQKVSRQKYSHAAGIPEEAFGAIRQVAAFGMQSFVKERYSQSLKEAAVAERRAQNIVACLIASMCAMPCLIYSLSFWTGSIFLVRGETSVTAITSTTLAVTIGMFAIIRIAPSMQALVSGIAISGSLFETISRRSPQDPLEDKGEILGSLLGNVQLNNVDLVYPSRDQAKVLDSVTLQFSANKTTAIVGPSGGGKSSILGLFERFYEPTSGSVSVDGNDIQSLNLRWLRQQIGLVDQDPILLDASISENIWYGCADANDTTPENKRLDMVIDAARKAYAHDFIMASPNGYQTRVGEKGMQLSGGQRQRIAIARALIRDPKILLLDEATSALDSASEKAIQAAIDIASKYRTTIIIAHRLSTIRNADLIVVLNRGQVADQGTHDELMARNGLYADLIEKQKIKEESQQEAGASIGQDEVDVMVSRTQGATLGSENEKAGTTETTRLEGTTNETSSLSVPNRKGAFSFLLDMSKPDWKVLIIGLICSILAGLEIPAESIFFAKLLTIIGLPENQHSQLRRDVNLWSGLYVALAAAGFAFWLGVGTTLAYATQKVSKRVRETCCDKITVQSMEFFDEAKNSPSALSNALSKSTDDLAGMGGPVMGGILTFTSTIIGGIAVSLAVGWKLALVCTATIPVVVACGWLRLQVLAAFDARIRQSGVDSAAYAGQIVRSMRTVASLGLEKRVLGMYSGFLSNHAAKSLRSILVTAALYAASQSVVYLCAALGFWYGGTLIANGEYSAFQVYVCFVCLISGSQIAGSIFTFAPDAGKAIHAAQELQKIAELPDTEKETQPFHATEDTHGKRAVPNQLLDGPDPWQVKFQDVSFAYPSRPHKPALNRFTVSVEPGKTLALVGQSGSGKSTCLALLERFYALQHGQILVDGRDIRSLDLNSYRLAISLISQEAVIFSSSMRDNIAVGAVGQDVSDDEILAACRQANILDFINSLPDGLASSVGTGGSMLSGGQKQRIAIARAFLRKSKLLLLDEATSALDSESEAVVQTAIEAVKKNRTTIMVAHRLSTVMSADVICVMREGSVAEIVRENLYIKFSRKHTFIHSSHISIVDKTMFETPTIMNPGPKSPVDGDDASHKRRMEYWTRQLEKSNPAEFLLDKPRPRVLSTSNISKQELKITGSLYGHLQRFCRDNQVSLLSILLAAFRVTHYRLSGTEDATIGTNKSGISPGPEDADTKQSLNTRLSSRDLQCIQIKVGDELTFEQVVRLVNETLMNAHLNQQISFEDLVSEISLQGSDLSRHPLIQTALSLDFTRPIEAPAISNGHTVEMRSSNLPMLDFEFCLSQAPRGLYGHVFFCQDLFHEETIRAIIKVFYEVLTRGMEEPQTPITSLWISGNITPEINVISSDCEYSRDSSIIEVFQRQVMATPASVAVKDSLQQMTYDELDKASDIIEVWLRNKRLAPETLVGVLASRSCQAVVAILGILKANLAYMPLDVKAPASRISAILSAAPGHRLILVGPDVAFPELPQADVTLVSIPDILKARRSETIAEATKPSATSLAYVMFTSGSTGQPKGVMIEHRGVVRAASVLSPIWGTCPVAHIANIAFDTSTSEIYTPLFNGGTIICVDDVVAVDAPRLGVLFHKEKVEVAVLAPALLKQCLFASPSTLEALHILFTAGDRLDTQDARRVLDLVRGGVFNSYGPTENSVLSTLYQLRKEDDYANGVPIGRPVAYSGAYVVDRELRLVAPGVIGELLVTGDGIARGYTDPVRDEGRFVSIVLIEGHEPVRAYRTGDCVRCRPVDGQLEFFGRLDYQVKIRGHRVELPEVEQALMMADETVIDAVTVVREVGEERGRDVELVSFVTISEADVIESSHTNGEISGTLAAEDKTEQGQIDVWKEHFDKSSYADIESHIDTDKLGRDFVGWTSMYDGKPIKLNEMNEWLDDTMTTLLGGGEPSNVLEIGTGSGMILFNLPQSIQSYVGLELSEQAASFANKAADTIPALRGKVDVHVGTVTDLTSIDRPRFNNPDLVVINSTVQYFPGPEYLLKAIRNLLQLGNVERLFIGDVRSYAMYREFQVSKALHGDEARTSLDSLRQSMAAVERAEEELLIDPAFFTALKERLPHLIEHVEILPKRMVATNELSCYRYAVVIHGKPVSTPAKKLQVRELGDGQWIDFQKNQLTRQSLLDILDSRANTNSDPELDIVAISNIPFSKLMFERGVLEHLEDGNGRKRTDSADWVEVCRVSATISIDTGSSLSAVDLHEIADSAGYFIQISCARQASQNGGIDAVFYRDPSPERASRIRFNFPTDHQGRDWKSFTNNPLHQRHWRQVEEKLRSHLKARLPSYMVPSVVRVLEAMPLNDNGKVDRRELTKKSQTLVISKSFSGSSSASKSRDPPQTELQRAVCDEFASVLGLSHDDVGISDDFYHLGGHSLQAARMVSRLNQRLGCRLYVSDLVRSPTPMALGSLIANLPTNTSNGNGVKGDKGDGTKLDISGEIDNNLEPPRGFSELNSRPQSKFIIVLVHGLWGQGSVFTPMIPFLDPLFDVLVLNDPFFGQARGPESIQQWAEIYLDHVQERLGNRPGSTLMFGGYSLGGLIAYEMASLWHSRYDEYQALLLLLDAAMYVSYEGNDNELEYGLALFGQEQEQMVHDHYSKISPLTKREPSTFKPYLGSCFCLLTPESDDKGAAAWWSKRCPNLQVDSIDCSHHDLVGKLSIGEVGRRVNQRCTEVLKS
ncbi:multidrug resistance 3 [Fusarium longipes]|uniref:Multidrug resistance 3 n=1 Tax=Fusarium longipes TaxID=694270 RepID=A0A395T5S2_9HYPO|nr:multidrug resistance 3 [Fusarium longipes]